MTIKDIATIITTIAFTIGLTAFAQWGAERKVNEKREELEQAALDGRQWMETTTAKLDSIITGVERITGEITELAHRVEALEGERSP
ncbi:MAG: hypothetical protein ACRC8D_08545 [Aeromonas sp.]